MADIRVEETQIPEDLRSGDYRLSDSLAVRIDWLNNAIERQTRDLLDEACGLTPAEWRCLATLCVRGPMTGSEIADCCSMSPAQASRSLRKLRDDGLIAWPAGTEKRGFGAAYASDAGWRMFDRVKPVVQSRNLWLLGGLEPAEQEEIYRLIAKLRLRMRAAPGLEGIKDSPEYSALTDA